MKKIEIVGKNYSGEWKRMRAACRVIILRENKILLSYETLTNQWMIPGGGLEPDESENDCCIREVAEETGKIIHPSECLLEIDEYYEEWKWVNRYYIGEIVGDTEITLTERERSVGMEARWLSVDEIMYIFSQHNLYANSDEMRRGMYLREYTALCEILNDKI